VTPSWRPRKARQGPTPRRASSWRRTNKVILAVTGNGGWKDKMWPKLLEVTGTSA
jgi:hypothetical protein